MPVCIVKYVHRELKGIRPAKLSNSQLWIYKHIPTIGTLPGQCRIDRAKALARHSYMFVTIPSLASNMTAAEIAEAFATTGLGYINRTWPRRVAVRPDKVDVRLEIADRGKDSENESQARIQPFSDACAHPGD